jgi:Protein of unknown function (DUF2934)
MSKTSSKANPKSVRKRVTSASASAAELSNSVVQNDQQVVEATWPADPQSTACREEAIRERAYSKWEEAGRPEGDGIEFWLEAERELDAE